MEQELKEQVNQILQKNLDEVYFSVAEKILNDHPKSRYLPWMLAHKMSPEEARVIDALPDKDWTPEVGELKVSKSFAEKLGMDKYEIDAQIMERFFPLKDLPSQDFRLWLLSSQPPSAEPVHLPKTTGVQYNTHVHCAPSTPGCAVNPSTAPDPDE